MTDARTIADKLIEAERHRTPIQPFTRRYPFLDVDTRYKAQSLFVDSHLDAGERLVGAKLGLTSRVKREALGIHEPLYGWLTSGMLAAPNEALPLQRLIAPRGEPEIAFLLGSRLAAPTTGAQVLVATEALLPQIEIVDSRYRERFLLPDSVADNAGAARVVLGPQGRQPSELEDLRLVGCVFRSGGTIVDTAAGGAVLGHPAAAVAWLVNTLAAQGKELPMGSVVLSGGLTRSARLRPGALCRPSSTAWARSKSGADGRALNYCGRDGPSCRPFQADDRHCVSTKWSTEEVRPTWNCVTCATSSPSPRRSTSAGRPRACTWPNRRYPSAGRQGTGCAAQGGCDHLQAASRGFVVSRGARAFLTAGGNSVTEPAVPSTAGSSR